MQMQQGILLEVFIHPSLLLDPLPRTGRHPRKFDRLGCPDQVVVLGWDLGCAEQSLNQAHQYLVDSLSVDVEVSDVFVC